MVAPNDKLVASDVKPTGDVVPINYASPTEPSLAEDSGFLDLTENPW